MGRYYLQHNDDRWPIDPLTRVFVGCHLLGTVQSINLPLHVRWGHRPFSLLSLKVLASAQGNIEVLTSRAMSLRMGHNHIETYPVSAQTVLIGLSQPMAGQYVKIYTASAMDGTVLAICRWSALSSRIILNRYSFRYSLDS